MLDTRGGLFFFGGIPYSNPYYPSPYRYPYPYTYPYPY